jgi:hypothetical protein|tara:strand:- start:496 stop:1209 length:714 start_codon:yes stop_codon:yes gene_type:complete
MSQNDLVISNQNFPATRADINNALQALGSSNSGATEPATTYASMLWHDTTAEVLKIRSEANDAWISIGYLDQSADAFRIFDDTQLVNTSGTQVGLLGDQVTATWQGGTGTLPSLVSPASVKAAIDANVTNSVKAWVSFNGTGAVSIRDSFNVSSVTDTGVGSYVVNFTTSLSSVNYAAVASVRALASSGAMFANIHNGSGTSFPLRSPQVSSYAISVTNRTNYAVDSDYVASAVFGN